MTTSMEVEAIHIHNMCLPNDYFLLDYDGEKSFKGTLLPNQLHRNNRKHLWEYITNTLNTSPRLLQSYLLFSRSEIATRKAKVWLLKNKTWEEDSLKLLISDYAISDKGESYILERNVIHGFFWLRFDLHLHFNLIDNLISTDRYYLVNSNRDITKELNLLISKGWKYGSKRQMQVPEQILDFLYSNNVSSTLSLGRFDDPEKDLLLVEPRY